MVRTIDRAEGIVKPLVPPHNMDMERAVLGAMLLEQESLPKAIELLTPADFYKEGHRKIFAAVLALFERNEPVDLLTVAEELKQRDEIEEVGGPAALAVLVEEAAATANLGSYVGTLREHATRRAIIALGYDLLEHGGIEPTSDLVARVTRRLEPLKSSAVETTVLLEARRRTGPRQLVAPLVESAGATVLFADGGSGKGFLALVVALAAGTGQLMPGGLRPTKTVPTLYLDWESTAADTSHRLYLLGQGLNVETSNHLHYRQMCHPLAAAVPLIRADVARLGIGMVVIDSFAPACGTEPETADSVLHAVAALRTLGVPCLVIAHVSKAQADQTGKTRPFGSVFLWNLARSCWEVKRSAEIEGDGEMVLGLYHVKVNEGPRRAPFGLRLTFDPPGDNATSVRVEPCPLSTADDLVRKLGLSQRILTALSAGALTAQELAEVLGAEGDVVSRTLRRLRAKGGVVYFQHETRTETRTNPDRRNPDTGPPTPYGGGGGGPCPPFPVPAFLSGKG